MRNLVFAFALAALPVATLAAPPPAAEKLSSAPSETAARDEVVGVLEGYKSAIEALDAEAATAYFWPEARVYEQGGVEGTFANYLAHHLGPELLVFNAFAFEGHMTEATVVGDFAYATETYRYRVTFKDPAKLPVERRGVATSVLHKRDGQWRILSYHASSRAPRPAG
ncbi:MAG: nuclear transport factor 2 family protein [Caulobacter sp.]|nr:nuclear transport factor 2 family protein [Caulobacter sp.]